MPHSHRSTARPAHKRRLGWGLSVLAGVAVLLLVAWWWALPAYIDHRLSQMLTERSGRQVTIDDVTLTPWRHQVTLDGLRIAGQADTIRIIGVELTDFSDFLFT